MFKSGLVSITFRNLHPAQIVSLAHEAQLETIEWGGDVHVPHGNVKVAKEVRRLTKEHGLEISSYGSYYYLGEKNVFSFESVLDCAIELEAPVIRVWAGNKGSMPADADYRARVMRDIQRIAHIAAKVSIGVALEYHVNTLTDSAVSAINLLTQSGCVNVSVYWQPRIGATVEENCYDIDMIYPWISNIHIFHWWPDHRNRHLLAMGYEQWKTYLHKFAYSDKVHNILIEFVKDDSPESFLNDAKTLRTLVQTE